MSRRAWWTPARKRVYRAAAKAFAKRSRAAKRGWRTRRQEASQRRVKPKPKVVRVPPPLPEVEPDEFELTRVAKTKRGKRDRASVQIDQTLRFVRKPGATMRAGEARTWLEQGKYGPVLAQFDVVEVDWTNEGDRERVYTTPRDVEAALDQSARMGWRYGPVRVL